MRSVMTVPVIVQRFVEKAPTAAADVVCLDLEDSVPPGEKEKARTLAAQAIDAMPPGPYQVYVRVNGIASGLTAADLAAVVRPGLHGIVLSKTDSPSDVSGVDAVLSELEREVGLERGSVNIVPLIETAKGVVHAYDICCASGRVVAAIFGAEDYATDMGIQRTPEGREIEWARNQVAVACRAAGVIAIDTPDPGYTDASRLEREMQFARSIGYRGKLVIHPAQVAIANRVFRPSERELAEARDIVAAFEREGLARGRAAISVGGKMIDTPIYLRARRLLESAGDQV